MNGPSQRTSRLYILSAVVLLSVTLWVYAPLRDASFLNFDDNVHISRNPFIREFSWAGIKDIFTTSVNKTYVPLTELSFALQYRLSGFDAPAFHLVNIILHVFVCFLVLGLGRRMGLEPAAALLAAVIFAVHPMHVEAVAWVTARKDVLYAFFYLIAVHQYLTYLQSMNLRQKRRAYILMLIAGLLSALAKPMALSLPLILLVFDWYFKRTRSLKMLTDKIPVALVIVPPVMVTHLLFLRDVPWVWPESFLLWNWTCVFYPLKFLELGRYMYLYWLPRPLSWANPAYSWAVAVSAAFLMLLWRLRKNRWLIFAVVYYLASAFFMFRMDFGSELNMVGDRYFYLPGLGVCLALGQALLVFAKRIERMFPPGKWRLGAVVCVLLIAVLAVKGRRQTEIWHDSEAFWQYQYTVEPRPATALTLYNWGYGIMLSEGLLTHTDDLPAEWNMRYQPAGNQLSRIARIRELFAQALFIKPDYVNVHYLNGVLALRLGENAQAEASWRTVLSIEPQNFLALYALGRLKMQQGDAAGAVQLFREALSILPDHRILREDILRAYRNGIAFGGAHKDIYRRELDAMKESRDE